MTITISKQRLEKKELDKKFNLNSKVIYNPLNKDELIKKSKKKCNFDFFNTKKELKIINVARFTDQKDHITLLKAFNIVRKKIPARLLLIGYGSNKNKILNFVRLNKLKNLVRIINFNYNPFKYIAKTDLFVLSSLYEGLPNVILEAMVLKKYVISSNCPTGPSEILKNGKFGSLFPIKNYKKLSYLILDYYKNRKKYNSKRI